MKRYPFTTIPALLLMCVTQLQAQHSKPQHDSQAHFYMTEGVEVEKSSETGWVNLFNGKDLTNWKTTGNWIVRDGVVTLHPRKGEHG